VCVGACVGLFVVGALFSLASAHAQAEMDTPVFAGVVKHTVY